MPTLAEIHLFPVKSCRGLSLERAPLSPRGVEGDRRFAVVGPNGAALSQKQYPRLALVDVGFDREDHLVLGAPHQAEIRVDIRGARASEGTATVLGRPEPLRWVGGPTVEAWWSRYMGFECRFGEWLPGPELVNLEDVFANLSFCDSGPISLISRASLDAFNLRLQRQVAMDCFRPNLVVDGCPAFAEDHWKQLRIGSLVLFGLSPIERCVMITIDPTTADKDPAVARALLDFHSQDHKMVFGRFFVCASRGEIRVGAPVEVLG